MENANCYILFSQKLNKFYVGATNFTVNERIEIHLNKLFGNKSFTAKADDWTIFLSISCNDYSYALRIEKKIKSMKSSIYIRNLKKYPELLIKVIDKTSSPSR